LDYRVFCVITLLSWGAWGFMCKLLSRNMSLSSLVLWTNIGAFVPVVVFIAIKQGVHWERNAPLAMVAGVLATVATVAFYAALRDGPASVVVPLTGLYILIPAALGFIFLREPLTLNHVIGLVCAVAAIFFLAR
jgi:transporter family protein